MDKHAWDRITALAMTGVHVPDQSELLAQAVLNLHERVAALEIDDVRKGEVGSYIIALRREVLERVEKLEAATKNTGEGSRAQEARGDEGRRTPAADVATGCTVDSAAPSPASSVPAPATGEVPAWIPSVEEMLGLIDDGREGDLISLIAIRAPAAPVVDVNALLTRFYSELDVCDLESKAMARALAAQGIKCKEVQP